MTRVFLNVDLDQKTRVIKILAFEPAIAVRVAELIGNDPGLADRLIIALMRVAVHPYRRLPAFDDLDHVQRVKGRPERTAPELRVGIDDRRVMADDHARAGQILVE